MKIRLEDYEPSERTFAACETPQELRAKYHTLIRCYDFLVGVHAITKYQRCELVDKLSDLYELRLKSFVEDELNGDDPA